MLKLLFGNKDGEPASTVEEPNTRNPNVRLPFEGEIATDTASLVVFDPVALNHRFDDACDWWADPRDELKELKARNALIVGLGSDGFYQVYATADLDTSADQFFALGSRR